jgi:sugar O-acyltransferase (sialic acid O-acetyltransferase NeuD family)
MTDLVIVGTGGLARQLHQLVDDVVRDGGAWNVVGFLDDAEELHGGDLHGLPVLGGTEWLADRPGIDVVVAVGAPSSRRRVVTEVMRLNPRVRFPTFIHPRAWLGDRNEIGTGSVVCAGALLETDLQVGDHVVVNLGASVAHEARVGDFVTIAPGVRISGTVTIGEGCDMGTGAAVVQGLEIGPWSVIGAGAVVTADIPPNVTAVGVPASPVKERESGWHKAGHD